MILNSKVPTGKAVLGLPLNKLEFCNVTYMCIKEPNGVLNVPDNYWDVVRPLLAELFIHEDFKDEYLYISIKKGHVQPYSTSMRSGYHVDGFLSTERSWIYCDNIPTTVALGQFDVKADHTVSLKQFSEQAKLKDTKVLKPYTLYQLDRECVHRSTMNQRPYVQVRTFIKIVASSELFNGYGNAWNYKLPHIKPDRERSEQRNVAVL